MNQYEPHVEAVTNRSRILHLLKRVKAGRDSLTLMLPNIETPFISNLTDISSKDNTLSLDEVVSQDGHQWLVDGKEFMVFGQLKGVSIRFTSRVQSINTNGDYLDYICELPNLISSTERRDNHRVQLSLILQPSLIISSDRKSLIGRAVDISIGGIGLVVGEKPEFEVATKIDDCVINLSDNAGSVPCLVRICHILQKEQKHEWKIGLQLLGMTDQHHKIWRNWVMDAERKLLRTHLTI